MGPVANHYVVLTSAKTGGATLIRQVGTEWTMMIPAQNGGQPPLPEEIVGEVKIL